MVRAHHGAEADRCHLSCSVPFTPEQFQPGQEFPVGLVHVAAEEQRHCLVGMRPSLLHSITHRLPPLYRVIKGHHGCVAVVIYQRVGQYQCALGIEARIITEIRNEIQYHE